MREDTATRDKGGPAWWLLALSVPVVLTFGLLFLTRPLADDNAAQTGIGGGGDLDLPLITSPSPTTSPTPTPATFMDENTETIPME